MKLNRFSVFFTIVFLLSCISCKTLKQPSAVAEPLNYTDEDVVSSEIERIEVMKGEEPVKALWRACLLGREEVVNDCYEIVKKDLLSAIDEKNYALAYQKYVSLKSVKDDEELESIKQQLDELYKTDAFIITGAEEKAPSTIAECVKATVTVWVDKGIKVENGIGMADIVLGSGFFIDKRGYIITNHHVISDMVDPKYEGFSRLYVKMHPDTDVKIPAKVIGFDPIMDLALLKVEVEPEFVLTLGSSSDLEIGDKVSAIGTPIGLEGTLTAGIISATDRKLLTLGNVFQIDAAVNSGNSGGPLIDEKMRVQAIVFAGMLQFQGLNFAIPVEYLKQELQNLYAGGEVFHSWIASYGRTVRKGKQQLGLEIQYVIPGGSGCMSKLKEGDVIYELNGNAVSGLDDFQFLLLSYEPDTILPLKYRAEDDEEREVLVYLDKRSEQPNALAFKSDFATGSFIPIFGMKLKASSTTNRNSYIIEKVIRGGIADEVGFSENDSITIKEVKVDTENEYVAALLYTKRRTKGYLDIPLTLSNSLDSPFYF